MRFQVFFHLGLMVAVHVAVATMIVIATSSKLMLTLAASYCNVNNLDNGQGGKESTKELLHSETSLIWMMNLYVMTGG